MSTPIVKDGRIVGFFDGWIGNRVYPVDMAGFAVNIQTLKQVVTYHNKAECKMKIILIQ